MAEPKVQQDPHRFFIEDEQGTAVLDYELIGSQIILKHTEVPAAARGRGVGGALAHAALEHAREKGYAVIPVCPHVIRYLSLHPEYQSLVRNGRFVTGKDSDSPG